MTTHSLHTLRITTVVNSIVLSLTQCLSLRSTLCVRLFAFDSLLSTLCFRLFAFESCTISPVGAVVSTLLLAAAPTVQAVAAAAVGAGAVASAAGGGGGGPAALAGAQRNSLMGTLGGAPSSCEDPRATSSGGGWTMGRLGVGSSTNPCETEDSSSQGNSGGGTSGGGTSSGTSSGGARSGRRLAGKEGGGEGGEDGDAETAGNVNVTARREFLASMGVNWTGTGRKPLITLVENEEDQDLVQQLLVVALGTISARVIIGFGLG